MPKLKPHDYEVQNTHFQAILADHMVRQKLNKGGVGDILRLKRCAASRYIADPGKITVEQLRRLIKELRFSKEEISQMLF